MKLRFDWKSMILNKKLCFSEYFKTPKVHSTEFRGAETMFWDLFWVRKSGVPFGKPSKVCPELGPKIYEVKGYYSPNPSKIVDFHEFCDLSRNRAVWPHPGKHISVREPEKRWFCVHIECRDLPKGKYEWNLEFGNQISPSIVALSRLAVIFPVFWSVKRS